MINDLFFLRVPKHKEQWIIFNVQFSPIPEDSETENTQSEQTKYYVVVLKGRTHITLLCSKVIVAIFV